LTASFPPDIVNELMKPNKVNVFSDAACYWWRWLAVLMSLAMFYLLGIATFKGAPAHTFHMMLVVCGAVAVVLALIHRPHSYQIEVTDTELRLLRVPAGAVKRAFKKDDVKYITIRNTGHLFGLSVIQIIVRTKQEGSKFFGPIYYEGIDGVVASEVAQLLPRISREGLMTARDSKSS
jgi:hypothetical protein